MIKGYIGKDKNDKYKPMLFTEILKFYQEAPKKALRLFWTHIKKAEYREAINLLKQFLKLELSDETIREFLQDEGEQIITSKDNSKKKRKFPQRGFLPRENLYALTKKEQSKGDKYWESSKAEDISPTGFDMKVQHYEHLDMPKASIIELENKIEAMLLEGKLEEEIILILSSDSAQFKYDCVSVDDNQLKELVYIKDNWEEIDYNEFMDNVDFSPFEYMLTDVPPLKKDFAVMFYKSKLENGSPVWVMKHSAIEHVFY